MRHFKNRGRLIVLLCFTLSGCSTIPPESVQASTHRGTPPVLATGSPEEIEATAIADARADIEARRPRVAITGGDVAYPVGIPNQLLDLVKGLPVVPLPCGCTDPLLSQAQIYARSYNKEILQCLLKSNAVSN